MGRGKQGQGPRGLFGDTLPAFLSPQESRIALPQLREKCFQKPEVPGEWRRRKQHTRWGPWSRAMGADLSSQHPHRPASRRVRDPSRMWTSISNTTLRCCGPPVSPSPETDCQTSTGETCQRQWAPAAGWGGEVSQGQPDGQVLGWMWGSDLTGCIPGLCRAAACPCQPHGWGAPAQDSQQPLKPECGLRAMLSAPSRHVCGHCKASSVWCHRGDGMSCTGCPGIWGAPNPIRGAMPAAPPCSLTVFHLPTHRC